MDKKRNSAHIGLEIEPGALKPNPIFSRIQIFLRGIILLILLLAIFGFFGTGILGPKMIVQNSLAVHYQPYARLQANNMLTIDVDLTNNPDKNSFVALWIDPSLQNHALIKSISPTPSTQSSAENKIIYYFKLSPPVNKFNLVIASEPFKVGIIKERIGVVGGPAIFFNQFIYP